MGVLVAEKFNREITFTLRERIGGTVGPPASKFGSQIEKEEESYLPYKVDCTITKSMTSNADECTLTIQNFEALEDFYQEPELFIDEYSKKDYILTIFLGYEDFHQIYSGDLMDLSVTGGSNITDQAIVLKASSGQKALTAGKIKKKFSAGQSFRDITGECFKVYEAFGIKFEVIDDPFNKLSKTLKKPRTEDRLAAETLNDVCRELDMTWGIAERHEQTTPQIGYFVDKKSVFDVGIFGRGVFDVSYKTGLLGLPSFSKSQFTFNHRQDKRLNLGVAVDLSVSPQINTASKIRGRISAIAMSLTNKVGVYNYTCTADFMDSQSQVLLANLNNDRRNVGSGAL